MQERGLGIRSGAPKQGWEESDFPILCEPCLGDSQYIRMLKHLLGKECKICGRPFTVFKWKAGTNGRFKKTEICQTCAKLKNVCQTCLFDLQYGLPVEIRDKFLGDQKINVPICEGNRDYWAQLATQNLDQLALPYQQTSNPMLEKISRNNPQYDRNKPSVCTFWQKGECTRGSSCPFRHEDGPELQNAYNIKDRFYGVNDPIAKKILTTIENSKYIKPPEDKSITTLVASLVDKDLVDELKNVLSCQGDISDIHLLDNHAFVTFANRKSAEEAMRNTYSSLVIRGKNLHLVWAKKVEQNEEANAVLNLPEFSLAPAFDVNLQAVSAPPPPKLPPVETQTAEQQNDHLLSLMKGATLADYSATKAETHGGIKPTKKAVKINLVDY